MKNNFTRAVLVFALPLFLFLNLATGKLYASHMMGADLTYQCLGGLNYKLTLRFYRDCAGASAPTSVVINMSSGCSAASSVTATQVGPPVEVSAICPTQISSSSCNGGNLPGVQQYTYSANVTLPVACANWVFSWSSCCRNYAINTGPGGNSIYVAATLNNIVAPCNTSPVFSSYPVPYFCQGQNANYNHGAFDVDGDSLTYQMVMPLQAATTNVTFNAPYSPTYPIATLPANSFGFNNLTGQMNFTPALVQQGVVAVRVFEWRNGVVIGSVTRDIQLVTINCINNSNVQISPIQNLQGATSAGGNYNIRVCAGNTASFTITASDPNAATILSMLANIPANMTGATFTTTGNNPKVGTFTWPTNASNIGYNNFTITVTDNNCPIPSTQVIGLTINVFGVDISAGNFAICPGTTQNIQLNASVGGSSVGCTGPNCYSWSPATGLSATNIPNPIATVSQPITYTVTFNDGTCIANDQVSITAVGSVIATPATSSICNGGSVQLNATNTFPNQGACGSSNAPCVGGISLKTVGNTTTYVNSSTTSVTPYQGWWHDGRIQMLIRANELTAAGITPGLLRSVAFQLAQKYSTIGYQGFTIQIGCTSQSALTGFITTGLTQVYTGTVSPVVGWNTYNFTTPYQWDGTSNIVVQVCHDNGSYTSGDPVYYNTTAYNSVYYAYQDYAVGCALASGYLSTSRPNMRFNFCSVAPPVSYTWTSLSGSGVSSLSSTTIANPVASPTQPTVYVVGASNGSCTVYDTVTVNFSNSSTLNDIPDQLSCPNAPVTLTASGTNINTANVTWSGGLTGPSITVSPAVTTIYTYSVNTPCGNLSQSTTITVGDNVPPTISNCPANISVNNTPNVCGATVSWVAPTANDNCSANIVQTLGPPSGSVFPVGTTTVTYTATDVGGNTATCSFTVTVTDNQIPAITCPANVTVNTALNTCQAAGVALGTPITSDNCAVLSVTNNAPAVYPLGVTTVTWTVTDNHGNTNTCTQTVTVVDAQVPAITCPANVTVNADPGVCNFVGPNLGNPITSDNCGVLSVSNNAPANQTYPVGTTTITWTVNDVNGNSNTCTQTVTVIDAEAPVIQCPNTVLVNSDPGVCQATIPNLGAAVTTDNCGVLSVTNNAPAGLVFPVGFTFVTWTVTDVNGNTATCQQVVGVEDHEAPVIVNCPANILVNNDIGVCGANINWVAPTVTDNCTGASITQTTGLQSGSIFPIGTSTITYIATDAHNNKDTCIFTITVIDNENPVIINCPANITVNNTPGVCEATVTWVLPTVSDNCPNPTIVQAPGLGSGAVFPVGTTTVTYNATDASGNTATCSFTVTVMDNENPVIINCPANISLNNDLGVCGATVTWISPTVTDNCPNATIIQTTGLASGSIFPLGTTTITYNATDAAGNTATCTFDVTVTDNENPVIANCPANISVNNDLGVCGATVSWVSPTVTDNCPNASITQTAGLTSGSVFPLGTTTITYTANDANGNSATCSFTVTVTDNELPLIANCPANISLNNDLGVCGATATWVAPTVSDNCPNATITQTAGLISGSVFPLGTTTITYTANDANGNSATCTFTVTVTDTENPVIANCPANISVAADPAICGAVITWAAPTVSDNCPNATITQTVGLASGATFPIGTTNVTYTAADANGNTATCSFTVTVTDNENPVIVNCPANISVNNDLGVCGATVTWLAPTTTDNCSATITQTTGLTNGAVFPLGTTTITYVSTDLAGNTATCTFDVTVTDNELPVIVNCPANISVNNDLGVCGAVVTWIAPTVSDNCPNATISQTAGLAIGSVFPLGTTTITYTATDANGNSATCSFTVTVTDNELPVIANCPANISVNNDLGVCGATITWAAPTVSDNCPNATITQTSGLTSGSVFPLGTTTITYTATDANGNSATCSFTVTVTDNELPVIANCPANISVNNDVGVCGAVITWVAPTVSDNCPNATMTQTSGLASGATFPIGTTIVTYTAIDANGNSATCSFTVTVTDTENPVIVNCPANISVNNDLGVCGATVTWATPTTTDNCSATITQTTGLASGAVFPLGITTITYVSTDLAGNTATCTFDVIVTDNENPVIVNCPANISVNNDLGVCGAAVTWTAPTVTDNCPNAIINQTAGLTNGSVFPLGTTSITYVATDANGNTATCSFTITVTDNENPVIVNCPANISVNNDLGVCGATVTWAAPTVSDNCPNATITQTAGLASGSIFPLGMTAITYVATDASGNFVTCSFTITVTDTENPVIANCPANINLPAVAGVCGAVATWVAPTVSDNCPNATITQTAGLASGATFPIGTTTITYTATDANGNTASCSFTVTVTDGINPVISGCPANISVNNDLNVCGATVTWTQPTVSDNCSATITQTAGLASGSVFPIGTSNITYTATDLAGNTVTCSFTVTVTDNQLPTISNCPANITINNTTGNCDGIATWTAPTITDNCPGLVISSTSNSGDVFPVGLTNVTITATDASGNVSTCTFSVTVNDTENPTITNCPSTISVNANANCQAIVNWTAPTITDNCAGMNFVSTANSGSAFPLGTTTVTYTATDAAGNVSTCSFNVIVTDNTPPVIANCPANISVNSNAGVCGAIVNWATPTVSDNCPNATITQTAGLANGALFPIGTSTVTYAANDANGNSATCSFTVTVTDNENPLIANCPSNITLNLKARCDTVVTWVAPTITDNCTGLSVVQTHTSGAVFPIGITPVTYTATDASGNISTCSFTVTVIAPPTIFINANTLQNASCAGAKNGSATVTVSGGSGAYTYTWNTAPPQYTATATAMGAGTYTVTVRDALAGACVVLKTAQVTITQPTQLTATLQKTNPLCNGDQNGSIAVTPAGGTMPYAYSWNTNPVQIAPTATNLGAGTYTVVVTDANGCSVSKTTTLTEPAILASTITPKDVKCFGLSTGSAQATTTGGTLPYAYVWMNSVSTTSVATGYPAGTYTVTITDAKGCNITKNFSIAQPAQPLNITTVGTDASCFGEKDGSAVATVSGGTSPYNVVWNTNPQQIGLTAINLKAGTVKATATDANGCVQVSTVQIQQPPRIDIDILYVNEAYCNRNNGSALVSAAGGQTPYTYTWNSTPPQYGANLINAGEGVYEVDVYDGKGCHDSISVAVPNEAPAIPDFITEPSNANPILLSQANIHFQNQSTGAVAYSWDFGDGNSDTKKNTTHLYTNTGTYTVTLTAFNSYGIACPATDSLTLTIIPDGTVFIATGFSPNGDGINDVIGVMGEGMINFDWTIFDRWGKIVYTSKNVADTWDGMKDGKAVSEGVYTYKLTVTLNNGTVLNRAGSITVIR